MGGYFSISDDPTREDILNEYFGVDEGTTADIAPPLEMEDMTTNNTAIQCKICNLNIALFNVIPCQHRCICNGCLKQIYNGKTISLCPHPDCNKIIKQII